MRLLLSARTLGPAASGIEGVKSAWVAPISRDYTFECCDCGLVHRMDFRIVGGKQIQFRVDRDNRATAAHRRNILMPFKKVGKNKFKSPSGRTYTKKQVAAYYATGGWSRPVRKIRKGRKKKRR
jgi:hypothetical protein